MAESSNQKTMRRKRAFLLLLFLLCVSVAAYFGYKSMAEIAERKQGDGFYASLLAQVDLGAMPAETKMPLGTAMGTENDIARENDAAETPVQRQSEIDFDVLRMSCPDVVGWLRIEGTVIDYPIVQGVDNEYYLNHLPNRTANSNGSIMMDQANNGKFGNAVNILHGHHLRNGSMFGNLDAYKEEAYYQEHPVIRLYTPKGDCDVAIFAAYTVNGYTFGYPTAFKTEADFDAFIRKAVSSTAYETDVAVNFGDRLLMLSTCAYSYEGARFIVLGKIVEQE